MARTRSCWYKSYIDLGCWKGHFDVSVFPSEDEIFHIRSSSGEIHLGEEIFDNPVVNHLIANASIRETRGLCVTSVLSL